MRPHTPSRSTDSTRDDGTRVVWCTFTAAGTGRRLRTVQEMTQPNREARRSWATGLEPIYLEGAFGRARPDSV